MLLDHALPPEFDAFLAGLAHEPHDVRELSRYAIFLWMIDSERVRITEMRQDGETLHIIVQTRAGDRFEVIRPEMSEDVEQALLEKIRERSLMMRQ